MPARRIRIDTTTALIYVIGWLIAMTVCLLVRRRDARREQLRKRGQEIQRQMRTNDERARANGEY